MLPNISVSALKRNDGRAQKRSLSAPLGIIVPSPSDVERLDGRTRLSPGVSLAPIVLHPTLKSRSLHSLHIPKVLAANRAPRIPSAASQVTLLQTSRPTIRRSLQLERTSTLAVACRLDRVAQILARAPAPLAPNDDDPARGDTPLPRQVQGDEWTPD